MNVGCWNVYLWEKECEEVVMMLGCGIWVKSVGWDQEILVRGG
jgi:hypothetical protein